MTRFKAAHLLAELLRTPQGRERFRREVVAAQKAAKRAQDAARALWRR